MGVIKHDAQQVFNFTFRFSLYLVGVWLPWPTGNWRWGITKVSKNDKSCHRDVKICVFWAWLFLIIDGRSRMFVYTVLELEIDGVKIWKRHPSWGQYSLPAVIPVLDRDGEFLEALQGRKVAGVLVAWDGGWNGVRVDYKVLRWRMFASRILTRELFLHWQINRESKTRWGAGRGDRGGRVTEGGEKVERGAVLSCSGG